MAKFSVIANKDSTKVYIDALVQAGHERIGKTGQADFMLIDHEHAGGLHDRIEEFLKTRPVFVTPHTPLAYFLWDGHYSALPISCNFVVGSAAEYSMRAYGYPYRIEQVGFHLCEVRPFQPTTGTRLLFVPARTRGDGSYASKDYARTTPKAWQWILDHLDYFEQVTVCYVNDFMDEADYLTSGIKFIKTFPQQSAAPAAEMLERIGRADLVISCETVGCLSVALGKPTVFYNAKTTATSGNIPAANFEKYRQYYAFPVTLEDLTIQDVLAMRKNQNSAVELWKRGNIGGNFDAEKFISVIEEFVRNAM